MKRSYSMTISNFAFSPASAIVSIGTKVTWTYDDAASHTATQQFGCADAGTTVPRPDLNMGNLSVYR